MNITREGEDQESVSGGLTLQTNQIIKYIEYTHNPSYVLAGHFLEETTAEPINVRNTRIKKIRGKLETVFTEDKYYVTRDKGNYTKFFNDTDALDEFIKLSINGQRLISYISRRINYGQSWFIKLSGDIEKKTGLDTPSISRTFRELLDTSWIYKASDEKNKYWINIAYFCKGSREEMLREYYKVTR